MGYRVMVQVKQPYWVDIVKIFVALYIIICTHVSMCSVDWQSAGIIEIAMAFIWLGGALTITFILCNDFMWIDDSGLGDKPQ